MKKVMNKFLPINTKKLVNELKNQGIKEDIINNIDWTKCIKDNYCSYIDDSGIICLLKKENKRNNFCGIHLENEINIIEEKVKNININKKDKNKKVINEDKSNFKTCLYLDDDNINKLYIKTNELYKIIKCYKEGNLDFNHLCNGLIEYNNLLYEKEKEPYISISYFLQMLEEVYETSNNFFDSLIYNHENNDEEQFIKTCKKWKESIKEIFNEINILPEYYKEYYIIINNKIDNKLFKSLN